MTVSVVDFIEAVVARVNADRSDPIPSFIGKRYINQNDSPPRLVWIPTEDTFRAPDRTGGSPKVHLSRAAGLQVGVWGPLAPSAVPSPEADLRGTEELLRIVLVALRATALVRHGDATPSSLDRPSILEIAGGEWVEPGEVMAYGMLFVLRLALRLPVNADEPARQTIETIEASDGATPLIFLP